MLAKVWKKLLLAICIIAVLFNITVKLVNRTSLEKAIKSSPEGVNVKEVLNITEEEQTSEEQTSTTKTTTPKNTVSEYKTVEETQVENQTEKVQSQEPVQVEIEERNASKEIKTDTKNDKEQTVTGGEIIDLVTDAVTNAKEQTESLY